MKMSCNDDKNTERSGSSMNGDSNIVKSLFAGSLSGMISQVVIYPFDVIRTRVQSSGLSVMTAARSTMSFGWRNLYVGLSFPLCAQAVYKATIFTVNTIAIDFLDGSRRREKNTGSISRENRFKCLDTFLCGAIAGSFNAALFVTPVEVSARIDDEEDELSV